LSNTKPPIVPMCSTFNNDLFPKWFSQQHLWLQYFYDITWCVIVYDVVKTRPDIAYSVNRLATRESKATMKDFEALLPVASYLGEVLLN
jgi:hypothetical protein